MTLKHHGVIYIPLGDRKVSSSAVFYVLLKAGAQSVAIYELKKKLNELMQLQQKYRNRFQHC